MLPFDCASIFFASARISGCIINTCGWVTGEGFRLLLDIAKSFDGERNLMYSSPKLILMAVLKLIRARVFLFSSLLWDLMTVSVYAENLSASPVINREIRNILCLLYEYVDVDT